MRVASCWEPTEESQHRHVAFGIRIRKPSLKVAPSSAAQSIRQTTAVKVTRIDRRIVFARWRQCAPHLQSCFFPLVPSTHASLSWMASRSLHTFMHWLPMCPTDRQIDKQTDRQTDKHPNKPRYICTAVDCITVLSVAAQSCPWVGLTRGLGWVEIFQFWSVGSSIATVQKIWKDYVNVYKA